MMSRTVTISDEDMDWLRELREEHGGSARAALDRILGESEAGISSPALRNPYQHPGTESMAANAPDPTIGTSEPRVPFTIEFTGPDLSTIPPGLYELQWKDGRTSLAAVGMNIDGTRWYAPCDRIAGTVLDVVVGATAIRLA